MADVMEMQLVGRPKRRGRASWQARWRGGECDVDSRVSGSRMSDGRLPAGERQQTASRKSRKGEMTTVATIATIGYEEEEWWMGRVHRLSQPKRQPAIKARSGRRRLLTAPSLAGHPRTHAVVIWPLTRRSTWAGQQADAGISPYPGRFASARQSTSPGVSSALRPFTCPRPPSRTLSAVEPPRPSNRPCCKPQGRNNLRVPCPATDVSAPEPGLSCRDLAQPSNTQISYPVLHLCCPTTRQDSISNLVPVRGVSSLCSQSSPSCSVSLHNHSSPVLKLVLDPRPLQPLTPHFQQPIMIDLAATTWAQVG